ncbi:hypothetical protein L0Z72_14390, partial [candidate division KSB1 bacterium]|nr:hypothetical protein [candidate division KSB1 bacterium]
ESHHSHFVLVDSGKWGDEAQTMNNLINIISENRSALVLLVNGGEIALREIEYSVREKRNILVAKGSGRLADNIADACEFQNYNTNSPLDKILHEGRITILEITQSKEKIDKIIKQKLKE